MSKTHVTSGGWGWIEFSLSVNEKTIAPIMRRLAEDLEWLRVRPSVEGLFLSHHGDYYQQPDTETMKTVRGRWGAVQVTLTAPDEEVLPVLARVLGAFDELTAQPGVGWLNLSDNMGPDGKVWKHGPIQHGQAGRA